MMLCALQVTPVSQGSADGALCCSCEQEGFDLEDHLSHAILHLFL